MPTGREGWFSRLPPVRAPRADPSPSDRTCEPGARRAPVVRRLYSLRPPGNHRRRSAGRQLPERGDEGAGGLLRRRAPAEVAGAAAGVGERGGRPRRARPRRPPGGRGGRASAPPTRPRRPGWRPPGRRCPAPSRAPARTSTGTSGSGRGSPTARCRSSRPPRRPGRDRMSPKRLDPTMTSKRPGSSTSLARERVDVLLVPLHAGVPLGPLPRRSRPRRASCARSRWTWWPRSAGPAGSPRARRRGPRSGSPRPG